MRWSLFAASAALFAAGTAQADLIYGTGFENPVFSAGPIAGQDGWSVFSASGQQTAPVIQSATVQSGTQAVAIPGSVGGQTGPYFSPNLSSPQVISMAADLFFASGTSDSLWQFAAIGNGGVGFAGGLLVSGTNVQAITATFPVVGSITRDAWHRAELVLDYGQQTYAVNLDGNTLASGLAFCGDNGSCAGAPVTTLGWAFFDTFGNGTDSGAMDNFSLTEIPEPASLALLGFGLAGLAAARRPRRS